MEIGANLGLWLFLWVAILLIITINNSRKKIPKIGLVTIFAFNFTKEYWLGGAIYLFPWYAHTAEDLYFTSLGFAESSKAFIAFAIGNLILAPFFLKIFRFSWIKGKKYLPNLKLPIIYIITGYAFYFLLRPVLMPRPSIRTFVHSGWHLMVAGICLIIWKNWCIKNKKMFFFWLFASSVAPFFTTIAVGFLGVGTGTLIVVAGFTASFYRPRWHLVLGFIVAIYIGLSFYVNYMEVRAEIRHTIGRGASFSERVDALLGEAGQFEFFNVNNQRHLGEIDSRLNLNYLTGAAIDYLREGNEDFAKGETIKTAVAAVVPRMLWPDKPVTMGGSETVTKYTGITFPEGTSVAMGMVMDFYVNFGTLCVIVGFMLLGILITVIDRAAGFRLESGDWKGFTFWFIPGMVLLTNESLINMTMTASATIVFCLLVNKNIIPLITKQKRIQQPR